MKHIISFFFFIVIFANFSFGQLKIEGKVSDKEGNPLPGVVITLNHGQRVSATDNFGSFIFTNLPSDKYNLRAEYPAYESVEQNIELLKNTIVDFELKSNTINELDQVIVEATRSSENSPFVYSNVQKEQIEKNNIGQDIPYILELTPSLVASSDAGNGVGYTSMSIRGTDITRINVTLNGIPLNDPESHGVWWVDVPDFASSVNSIQIQRGVGTSTNGAGAFGASINLKTNRLNADPYANISNTFGSFNTYKNTVNFGSGILNQHFSFDGRLSRQHSDGYIDRAKADFKSFFFSSSYFSNKTLIKATIFSGLENTYQAWGGVPKDSLLTNRTYNPYTYKNEIDYYIQTHFQLHFVRKINDFINFNASVFYITGKGYYEQYKEAESYSDYGLKPVVVGNDTIDQTDLIRRKWLDNGFYGLNYNLMYEKNKLNIVLGGSLNNYAGNHFGTIIWMQYAGMNKIDTEWYRNLGEKKDLNTYLKVDYQIFDKFFIYADVQFRYIYYQISGIEDDLSNVDQIHLYPFFNPKFGILYNLNKSQKIFASFALANREPKRSDFIDAPENKTPNPEKLSDFEIAYKINNRNLSFEANIYYMNYNNQLILTGEINDVGNPIVTNTPQSFRRGIELVFGTKIFTFLNWNSNISLSQNKIKNFTEYVDNWNYWDDPTNNELQITNFLGQTDISYSPSVIFSNLFSFKVFKFIDIDFISKYVGRQFIDNTSSIERSLNPYFVNDILFATEFNTRLIKKISFSVKINNIFNSKYETNAWIYSYFYDNVRYQMDGYFPQASRNFLLNLRFNF